VPDVRRAALLVCVLGLAAFPAGARAAGPTLIFGANEETILQPTLPATKANLELLKLTGATAVEVHIDWWPGMTEPAEADAAKLRNLVKASRLLGVSVYVGLVWPRGKFAPVTDEARSQYTQFAAATAHKFPTFRRFVIGNEPNLNLFFAPQFNPDGSDAAAPAYERLLAGAYDALKAVSRKIIVLGGAVSPRGLDDPTASSLKHTPVTFIQDLGKAYRASGRTRPIMDWLAFHPYQDNSSQLPTFQHKYTKAITIGDYSKLVTTLGQAFDGTAQRGSTLPILYDEYGLETTIPRSKAGKYTDKEPASIKPIGPKLQGQRYRMALQLAFCQPTVKGFFLYRLFDEASLKRWQSGVYFVDHRPKVSLPAFRSAVQAARRGVIARCPGLRLPIKARVTFGRPGQTAAAAHAGKSLKLRIRCDLDCRYTVGVLTVPTGRSVLALAGRAIGHRTKLVRLPARKLAKGRYRLLVSMVASVNPGRSVRKASRPFSVK
jgi:hypothetical protein